MTPRWWPRSIQAQMFVGLLLLEALSLGLFGWLITRQQAEQVYHRTLRRLQAQSESLASQAQEALLEGQPGWVALSVKMMGQEPNVAAVKVTDPAGNVLFSSLSGQEDATLSPAEWAQLAQARRGDSRCFYIPVHDPECVHAIRTGGDLRGFAWVESNHGWDYEELQLVERDTLIFGLTWIAASALLVFAMARSIARPLALLRRGARILMHSPESEEGFPLPVIVRNEIGDLIETFNRMVASLAEQRAGLNDTLSLLDSMLANAPIGLAFFDGNTRLVRVNEIFAEMTGVPLSRHLGRTLPELLPAGVAQNLEDAVQRVFATGEPVHSLELSGERREADKPMRSFTWLVSAYPVRTTPHQVRWAGLIVIDASERKRGEEALRNSEKLAVTGRLAASIAHEINNPLEAVTNLTFLLRNFAQLDQKALHYVEMLEYEVRRISEITQQTLRFYRQSTLPTRASLEDILDSVLSLYLGRVNALDIRVERRYDPQMTLFCFAGEIRQVVANMVGNSIDATAAAGGRLLVRARRSRNWKNTGHEGVRFVIADTGTGMGPEVREHIFEAFFTTKEATGTGLGLWVSHEIILKHHGLVHVRSRTPGSGRPSGTVFQFFIPDDPALAGESAPATS